MLSTIRQLLETFDSLSLHHNVEKCQYISLPVIFYLRKINEAI